MTALSSPLRNAEITQKVVGKGRFRAFYVAYGAATPLFQRAVSSQARRLAGALLLLALLAPAGSAAISQEDSEPASAPAVRADRRDLPLGELAEDVQALLRGNPTVNDYITANPGVMFRLDQRGADAAWRRVGMFKDRREVGFVIIQQGRIMLGRLNNERFGEAVTVSSQPVTLSPRPPSAPLGGSERAPRVADTQAEPPQAPPQPSTFPSTAKSPRLTTNEIIRGIKRVEPPDDETPLKRPTAKPAPDSPPAAAAARPRLAAAQTGKPSFLPMTSGPALMWVGVVVILLLTIRTDRWFCWRNFDGLSLAAACPLLLLRDASLGAADEWAGFSPRWWVYLGLSMLAGYWFVRGTLIARSVSAASHPCNVSPGAMLVLVAFSLGILATRIATADPTRASIDGVIGGRMVLAERTLPYGRAPGFDTRSPLLYLLHAGAMNVLPVEISLGGNRVPPEWDTRDMWLHEGWWNHADLGAARLVNGVLAAAALLALLVAGSRLHSLPAGLTMTAAFAVFPGSVEAANDPSVMLPAALLAWAVALATLPRFGGLLATICAVLAGAAWPYAWLALPVFGAYFLRRGWQGLGSVAGGLATAAACMAGLTALTQPSLPRADGALKAVNAAHTFRAQASADGRWVLERIEPPSAPAAPTPDMLKQRLWGWALSRDGISYRDAVETLPLALSQPPSGVDASSVPCRLVQTTDEFSRKELTRAYSAAAARLPYPDRAILCVRTLAEALWLPATPLPPPQSTWEFWANDAAQTRRQAGPGPEKPRRSATAAAPTTQSASSSPADRLARSVLAAAAETQPVLPGSADENAAADRWTQIRRICKIACGVWAVLLTLVMLFGKRKRAHQLLGAILSLAAFITFVQPAGAVAELPLLLVSALPLLAAHHDEPPEFLPAAAQPAEPRTLRLGPSPRISVE